MGIETEIEVTAAGETMTLIESDHTTAVGMRILANCEGTDPATSSVCLVGSPGISTLFFQLPAFLLFAYMG